MPRRWAANSRKLLHFSIPRRAPFFISLFGGHVAMEPLAQARSSANAFLSHYEPLALLITPLIASLLLYALASPLHAFFNDLQNRGLKTTLSSIFMALMCKFPGVHARVQRRKEEVVNKMRSVANSECESWLSELPQIGLGSKVIEKLQFEKSKDKHWQGKSSGAVYIGGSESEGHFNILNEAYAMFVHTNPLHSDLFPSVSKFEAEVVAMTAFLLGAKDESAGGRICGNMTSGGTESILMAVKSTRDYMKSLKGIKKPEMIIPESAHSAYDKAGQYFQIKIWRAAVNKDFQADLGSIKQLINRNTILIVGSAPGYPHGIIDPIEELGALAQKKGICFHVDLCLGGFVLPFARKLGYSIQAFDFTVAGVTSISVDIHKYGLGPKGTSVVLYRNHEIRQHQFVAVTEWSGGLYISPSMAGSRAGALIAGAWASMVSLGMDGYMDATRQVMENTEVFKRGISGIADLYIIGKPEMSIIAFSSNTVDIFKVNDAMAAKGWSLNALHKPSSLHICITLQHIKMADEFLKDLKAAVDMVKEYPESFENGMAPIYGAAAKMPNREIVKDLLIGYMDSTC